MTAQSSEILLLDGHFESLNSLPLSPYLEPRGIDSRAMSKGYCTSLWRGFVGLWEVLDGSLFLIGLVDFQNDPIDPATVFGELRLPILADWYSGRLEIDRGELLFYYHMPWGSLYAERLRLYIEHGQVVARRSYDHRKVLLRRFNTALEEHEEYRRQVAEHGSSPLGPLGGFTAAGLKVIGQSPVGGEPWPAEPDEWNLEEWVLPMLTHCVRPGGLAHSHR